MLPQIAARYLEALVLLSAPFPIPPPLEKGGRGGFVKKISWKIPLLLQESKKK